MVVVDAQKNSLINEVELFSVPNEQKSVIFICPADKFSNKKYKDNNIEVFRFNCSHNSSLESHKKGYKDSKTAVGGFFRWVTGSKRNPYTKPYKDFSLMSDNNKIIDMYTFKMFGCDAKFHFTPHSKPIAIIVDENGIITHILDNVNNEQDVLDKLNI